MTESMPWWSWIAIWGSLVLALVIMLGLCAWWLFRKFLILLDDVSELAGTAAILDAGEYEHVRPALAVLQQLGEVRDREEARRAHRAARRNDRHERRMTRARRISSVDASDQQWPADWYRS